jgi:hypothetical protein
LRIEIAHRQFDKIHPAEEGKKFFKPSGSLADGDKFSRPVSLLFFPPELSFLILTVPEIFQYIFRLFEKLVPAMGCKDKLVVFSLFPETEVAGGKPAFGGKTL